MSNPHHGVVGGRQRGPARLVEQVDLGTAELIPDTERPGGWTLTVDGAPQSYVNLRDPMDLRFEYIRWLAAVLDAAGPPGAALRVLHLGGGGLTLPRYVAAARPGSVQRVVERDAALIALVRRVLPLPKGRAIRVRAADARAAVEATGPARYDVVICDVYGSARVPGRLATLEFAAHLARVLSPGGWYAVNLADGPPLAYLRGHVSTMLTAFPQVCLIAERGLLRGRRFGNAVLVAGDRLPMGALALATRGGPFPARTVHGEDLVRFAAGTRPVSDEHTTDSPEPPRGLLAPRGAGSRGRRSR